jgi:predicted Zn-dependent protease
MNPTRGSFAHPPDPPWTTRLARTNSPSVNRTELEQPIQPALGYLQLNMMEEAGEELDALPPEAKSRKIVLELQVDIHSRTSSWQRMRDAARILTNQWPEDSQHWISLAYATRRCRSIAEAETILEKAAKLHPEESMIHFNLACYAAQTGNLAAARERLAEAELLDPGAAMLALTDPDLEPLRMDSDTAPTNGR